MNSVMLSEKEQKVLHKIHQRNTLKYLKQLYSKIKEHPDLTAEAQELKKEIRELESAMI